MGTEDRDVSVAAPPVRESDSQPPWAHRLSGQPWIKLDLRRVDLQLPSPLFQARNALPMADRPTTRSRMAAQTCNRQHATNRARPSPSPDRWSANPTLPWSPATTKSPAAAN